ncbi:Poly [ADP-ribose] polymerase tankyrase, partial [Gryllus bimaculatus]
SYLKKSPSRQASVQFVSGLASLLYLRGLNHADHFILAANLGGVGAFGDNVFLYRENERVTACFFHVLQAERAGAAPRLAGQLFSYFVSFRKVLSALPWLEEQVGEQIQEMELVCYTDAKLSAEASYSHADHIADGGGLVCGPAALERPWELCDEMNKYWDFLVDMAYDISEGVEEATLIASTEMFKSVVASEEIHQRVENLRNDLSENGVELLLSEMGGEVDRMDFKAFLEKFKVLHSQPDEKKLMELVKDEFLKLSGANSDTGAFSEEQLAKSLDEAFSSFLKGICKWVEEGDDWYSRYSQVWANVVTEVVRLIGDPMLKALASFDVKFIEDSLENLSEEILENSVVCVDCQSENTVLNLVKVHNVLEGLVYFLLNIGSLIKYRSLIVKALERFWCSVLVIDVTGAQISELSLILREIHRALSLNHDARLILVARNSKEILIPCLDMLEIKYENYVDVISWNSFSASCQTTLLNKPVHFQGVETTLGTLLGPYSEIFSEFQGDFLHSILTTKDMVVGCDLPAVADYFPRTLSRSISFNMTILRSKIANTLLALTGASLAEVIQVIPEGENYHIYDHKMDTMDTFEGLEIIVIENENDEQPFSEIAVDGNMSVHFFVLSDEKLSWKWSVGNMSTLDPYLLKEKADRFQIDDATSSPEKLTIVTGEEDTGKTTFLRHVARGTKEANANLWVVCLNLPEHEDFINNTLFDDPEELYPLLRELATYPYDSVLSDMLFVRYWRDGNIAVFIDGFESVPWHLTGQITDMIKLARSKARSVFVGCRSKIKNALCGNLCTFAFSLLPIGEDDQRRFLFNKWGNKVTDNNRLGVFVEAIMTLIKNSVGQEDEKLCCRPLLTAIVAHAFNNELLAFATSGNIAVPNKLNLIHFYEKYVEKCCYDFLMKRAATDTLTQQLLIENKLRLMDRYMILAVMLLIPKDDIKQMTVIAAQYQNYKDLRRLRQSSGEGSLITLVNDYPVFVHRTLPEYFLATWLSEVLVSVKEFVEERFLEPRYAGVRLWLDRVLARKQELHWAVLNGDEAAAGTLLAAGVPVNAADEGGRTALHLAAAHDMPHMVGLLVVAGADVGLADGVLGWRPLRYADRVRAWGALDRLLPAAGKAARHDLVATGRLLDSEVLLNAALVGACERGHVIDFEGSTALHIAAENGRTEMVEYLLQRELDEQTEKTLCHNLLRVFKGDPKRRAKADVNVQRNDGSSAVILAAQEGHADTLRALFAFEASANIKKLNGATALHAAVADNHAEAARVLLEAGAEADREDGERLPRRCTMAAGGARLEDQIAAATEGHAR